MAAFLHPPRPPPPAFPVFPTPTLASNPFPASADHIVFLDVSRAEQAFSCRSLPPHPPTFCCQEKLATKNKTTGRRGAGEEKLCPGGLSLPGFDPLLSQRELPQPGVGGRIRGRARRVPSGSRCPALARFGRSPRCRSPRPEPRVPAASPHPKPSKAAAPKCFLSALKQNPEGASFLPTSLRRALRAGRRLAEMNGPRPGWKRLPLPHPRID